MVDASVALTWCFADEADDLATRVLEQAHVYEFLVPQHWWLEVCNGLSIGERCGRISDANIAKSVVRLKRLRPTIDPDTARQAPADTLLLARKHLLTTYDAAYLELAKRTNAPLLTLDKRLQAACVAEATPVFT